MLVREVVSRRAKSVLKRGTGKASGTRRTRCSRIGFTLLEVIVVCVILSLIAGMVTLSLSGRIRSTRLGQVQGSIASADRVARTIARNNGSSALLIFDDDEVRVEVGRKTHKVIRFPAGIELSTVRLQRKAGRARGEVLVSSIGQSVSYGIELTAGSKSRWLVVSGLSGQVSEVTNAEQANALLRL